MIVVRPDVDERLTPQVAELTVDHGVVGDRWSFGDEPYLPAQVTLINSSVLDVIAGDRSRWPLAGDNLIVDLDLSEENLPAGTRLSVGSTELEVSEEPHTGCSKFASRFGADALRFVNLGDGRTQRRRGVNARVVADGVVRVGDTIRKASTPAMH